MNGKAYSTMPSVHMHILYDAIDNKQWHKVGLLEAFALSVT